MSFNEYEAFCISSVLKASDTIDSVRVSGALAGGGGANAPPPSPHEPKRSARNELIRPKKCELMKKNAEGGPLLENIPEG